MARKKREEISLFCGSRINAAKPHGACILAYMRRENYLLYSLHMVHMDYLLLIIISRNRNDSIAITKGRIIRWKKRRKASRTAAGGRGKRRESRKRKREERNDHVGRDKRRQKKWRWRKRRKRCWGIGNWAWNMVQLFNVTLEQQSGHPALNEGDQCMCRTKYTSPIPSRWVRDFRERCCSSCHPLYYYRPLFYPSIYLTYIH